MTRGFAPLVLPAALLLAGCASRTDYTPPQTYPVKGKVLLPGGEVLRFGRVTFHAKDKEQRGEPWADIAKDGSFTVTTFKHHDGAAPGQYVVTLHPYSYRSGNLEKRGSNLVPKRYTDEKTSDLSVDVKSQENVLELRLKSS